jgi:hypothetical protein
MSFMTPATPKAPVKQQNTGLKVDSAIMKTAT